MNRIRSGDDLRLTPKRPPGRSTRKARAFEAEIGLLRAQGYTFEAIREALAEAGVHVSKSTVQREVARHARCLRPGVADGVDTSLGRTSAPAQAPATLGPPDVSGRPPPRADLRSGKDIAQAFVHDRITNPLLRNRSKP